jgi:cupin 2 domain-containing protein
MVIKVENIFRATAGELGKEDFLTLLETDGVKVQRIVSHAAKSPEEFWYEQSHAEWVMIVRGQAILEFEGGKRIEMKEGDYLTIPPQARHRVHQTAPETIWLVVHLKEKTGAET